VHIGLFMKHLFSLTYLVVNLLLFS